MRPLALGQARAWLLGALVVGLAASISLAQAALAALVVVVLLERRPWAWPLGAPVAAFAAWTLLSAALAARPAQSLVAAKSLLGLAGLYVVLAALDDAPAAHRFSGRLLLAIGVVAAVAIAQVAVCPSRPPDVPILSRLLRKCDRAHGFYSIYMTLAGVLTLTLPFGLPRLLRGRRAALRAAPGWLTGVVALALTYVRGAWIGFAVAVVASLLALNRWKVALGALAAIAVVIGVLFGVSPDLRRRVESIGDIADITTRERVAMLAAGVAIVRDHPVLGVGVGQVKHYYDGYAPPEAVRRHTSHLHNGPLQIAAERGLPGLAAWVWLWAAFFARIARALQRTPVGGAHAALLLGSAAGIAGFLVAGLFEYSFGDTEVLLVAVSLMAAAFAVEREVVAAPGGRSRA